MCDIKMRSLNVLWGMVAGSIGLAAMIAVPQHAEASIGKDKFGAKANLIQGFIEWSDRSMQTIPSVDSSNTPIFVSTDTVGSSCSDNADPDCSDIVDPNCSSSVHGVKEYGFSNVDNLARFLNVPRADFGEGRASTGMGSLWDDFVTWIASSNDLRCDDVDDLSDHSNVACVDTAMITNLRFAGALVPAGQYAPGTKFSIDRVRFLSSSCDGIEVDKGTVTLLEVALTGNDTNHAEVDGTTLHLQGSSTCLGLLFFAVTQFDLKVGGTTVYDLPSSDDSDLAGSRVIYPEHMTEVDSMTLQ